MTSVQRLYGAQVVSRLGLTPTRPLEHVQLALLLLATACFLPTAALLSTGRGELRGEPGVAITAALALVVLWWLAYRGRRVPWGLLLVEWLILFIGVATQGYEGWFVTMLLAGVAYRASLGTVRDTAWLVTAWTVALTAGLFTGATLHIGVVEPFESVYIVSVIFSLVVLSAPMRIVVAVFERYEAAVARERALLSAGTALVATGSPDEVGAVAVRAAESLVQGTGAVVRWMHGELLPALPDDDALVLSAEDGPGPHAALGLARDAHAVVVAVTAEDHRRLLLVETPAALPRATVDALRALASTLALGLRSAATAHLLREQAHRDPLTRLANRALLEQRLAVAEARVAAEVDCTSVLLLVDLDGFKQVNDVLGHAAGDTVLVTVASRLLNCVRPDDLVARLGGDEFVILMEHVPMSHDVGQQAARVVLALSGPIEVDGVDTRISGSVGVARLGAGSTAAQAMAAADAAMYAAKSAGKSTYVLAATADAGR
jgi:diguanylate cyclase (GGDEF)-like protein